MVKLKKYKVHKAICNICNGNGFVKITDREDPKEINVHQCWECDSEGEFYVYEPKVSQYDVIDNDDRNTDKFLH
jgi:DnaJ-class molecular chaperone|tara:strand:- start:757 stop:978 length:222 start_codon:yes stop_codon:yes gene_type:complete